MKTGSRTQLRCCPVCNQVWEWDRTKGRELKYPDFPAFGLNREVCSGCKEVTLDHKEK